MTTRLIYKIKRIPHITDTDTKQYVHSHLINNRIENDANGRNLSDSKTNRHAHKRKPTHGSYVLTIIGKKKKKKSTPQEKYKILLTHEQS